LAVAGSYASSYYFTKRFIAVIAEFATFGTSYSKGRYFFEMQGQVAVIAFITYYCYVGSLLVHPS
jgi:hypothetical protein